MARLRYDHQELSPADPYHVAMRTALYGPQAILETDPEFATAVWIWETRSNEDTAPDWRYHRGDGGPTAGSRSDEPDRTFFSGGGHDSGGTYGGGGDGGGAGGG